MIFFLILSYMPNMAKISLFYQIFQIFDLIWHEIKKISKNVEKMRKRNIQINVNKTFQKQFLEFWIIIFFSLERKTAKSMFLKNTNFGKNFKITIVIFVKCIHLWTFMHWLKSYVQYKITQTCVVPPWIRLAHLDNLI